MATARLRPDLTMVLPTYNEREGLDRLVEEIFAACSRHQLNAEVIVVDDNSPDGTGACADAWARRRPVRVIHRAGKLGLGSAVLEGFAAAASDVVGVMDADLSHPPSLIPALFSTLKATDLDMVVASRYVAGGGTRVWSRGRAVLSRAGCWVARPLTPVHDAMSGYFLIRRDRAIALRTEARGFKIGLELLVRTHLRRVAEVGYVFVGRTAGRSKMTIREGLRFLRQLFALYRHEWSTARPTRVVVVPAAQVIESPRPRLESVRG
jgi:dolichol-phosphate mannosyltransferase